MGLIAHFESAYRFAGHRGGVLRIVRPCRGALQALARQPHNLGPGFVSGSLLLSFPLRWIGTSILCRAKMMEMSAVLHCCSRTFVSFCNRPKSLRVCIALMFPRSRSMYHRVVAHRVVAPVQ